MFRRKKRAHLLEVIELIRADVAAERAAHDAQVRTFQAALARERELQAASESRARQLQDMTIHTAREISRAVDDVVHACEVFGERVQSAHADHYALVEVIGRLIEATSSRTRTNLPELSPPDEAHPGVGSEVWCRYQNRWVGGFEIAEALRDGSECRFKIRRNSDGYVLPETFSPADVRPAKNA